MIRSFTYAAASLALGLVLSNCNSSPTATEADQTATVISSQTNAASDSAAVTAPGSGSGSGTAVRPTGPAPAWGPDIKPAMLAVIEQLQSFGNQPLPELTAPQARKQPGAAAAAQKQMRVSNIPAPPMQCDTMSRMLVRGVKARIYTPKSGPAPYPVIVYYHGGGWVIAGLDTYHASIKALCEKTGAVVVAVAYRQAPEHKFPAAHEDALAAYTWALKSAADIKGDPNRVAVAGESAGGNLAAAVSLTARDKGLALPKHQLLVYPIAGYDQNTPSYQENTETLPLNKAGMGWFFDKYLRSAADGKDPRINLVGANLRGLPPTTIIAADYDPLKSEGKTLADQLQAAGVKTNYQLYPGTTHEFFGMAAVVPAAEEAQSVAVNDLQAALK